MRIERIPIATISFLQQKRQNTELIDKVLVTREARSDPPGRRASPHEREDGRKTEHVRKKSGSEKLLYCSFCGKSQHEVKKLIAGPSVFICDRCIELCNDIIRDEIAGAGTASQRVRNCRFHGRSAQSSTST